MSASSNLRSALRAGLADDGTIAAALDVLREECGLTLAQAVAEVARTLADRRQTLNLQVVAARYRRNAQFRADVRRVIVAFNRRLEDLSFTLFFLPGFQPPIANAPGIDDVYAVRAHLSVSVGASWVAVRTGEADEDTQADAGHDMPHPGIPYGHTSHVSVAPEL